MANMREVNKAIKAEFPYLEIDAIRGCGYVYFYCGLGVAEIDSVFSNPVTTPTNLMARFCIENIRESLA